MSTQELDSLLKEIAELRDDAGQSAQFMPRLAQRLRSVPGADGRIFSAAEAQALAGAPPNQSDFFAAMGARLRAAADERPPIDYRQLESPAHSDAFAQSLRSRLSQEGTSPEIADPPTPLPVPLQAPEPLFLPRRGRKVATLLLAALFIGGAAWALSAWWQRSSHEKAAPTMRQGANKPLSAPNAVRETIRKDLDEPVLAPAPAEPASDAAVPARAVPAFKKLSPAENPAPVESQAEPPLPDLPTISLIRPDKAPSPSVQAAPLDPLNLPQDQTDENQNDAELDSTQRATTNIGRNQDLGTVDGSHPRLAPPSRPGTTVR